MGHHRQVPYHLLKGNPTLSVGADTGQGPGVGSGNLLVQGDNLLALKALLPYYAGRVKCIYIDPPYNTGNEKWVYNDNVNSPEIRQWLGRVVGKEGETLDRHDRWLCMMYPRLALLKEFLSEDGAIFVSIDDNEVHHLRSMMDEVFGLQNWVCTLVWKRREVVDSRNLNGVSADHDFLLCYGRTASVVFQGAKKDLTKYTNPDNDPRGPWMSDNLTGLANAMERPNLHYDVVHPVSKKAFPPHSSRGWAVGRDRMADLIVDNRILWPKKDGRPRLKRYLSDMKNETTGFSTFLDAPSNTTATKELAAILGAKTFVFPKPSGLIDVLLSQITDNDSLILDSFAGSGTTAHAVLAMNKADGGNRRCILIEMDEKIATTITAQRLTKVIEGYHPQGDTTKPKVEGTGGGFRYVTLGEPLFNEAGELRGEVRFAELAAHVFFTETGEPLPGKVNGRRSPLIGVCRGTAYYLLFNGILGDKRPDGGNVLTGDVLAELPKHPAKGGGPRIVFGEACRLGAARLKREGVAFRQIPYQVKIS